MGYRVVVDFDLCESNARCMEAALEVSACGTTTSCTSSTRRRPTTSGRRSTRLYAAALQGDLRRRRVTEAAPPSSSSARRWPACGRPRSRATAASAAGSRWSATRSTGPTTARPCPSRCWRGPGTSTASRSPSAGGRTSTTSTSTSAGLAPGSRVDLAGRRVTLAGGEELPYDGLVIATGAWIPRSLPGTGEPPASIRCAPSTTAWRPGRLDARRRPGGGRRGRVHRSRWRPPAGAGAATSPC